MQWFSGPRSKGPYKKYGGIQMTTKPNERTEQQQQKNRCIYYLLFRIKYLNLFSASYSNLHTACTANECNSMKFQCNAMQFKKTAQLIHISSLFGTECTFWVRLSWHWCHSHKVKVYCLPVWDALSVSFLFFCHEIAFTVENR